MKNPRLTLALVTVFAFALAQQLGSRGQVALGNQGIPDRVEALEAALASRTGTVIAFAGTADTVPDGWLLCDGSEVDRQEFAALFSTIGETHGEGDGASTFNLPDYRGRFLRGVDHATGRDPDAADRTAMNAGGNIGDAIGSLQGFATAQPDLGFATDAAGDHSHVIDTAPAHAHTTGMGGVHSHSSSGGAHTHPFRSAEIVPGDELGDGDGDPHFARRVEGGGINTGHSHVIGDSEGHDHGDTGDAGAHGHSAQSAGTHVHDVEGGDDETRPSNAYVNWIIKT